MDSSRAEGSWQYHGEAGSSIPVYVQAENEQINQPNSNYSQAPAIQNSGTQSPIYLLAKDCLRRFEGLYVALHNSHLDGSQQLTFDLGSMQSTIEDAHTRFRAWGTNIAAFRNGTSRTSLDFRLAEAPRIKYRVMQVLEDLQQYLSEVDLIARGKKINETWGLDDTSDSSDYSDEDNKDQKGKGVSFKGQTSGSDLGELLKAITASNASLMKLSIVIRSSATRDDYLKAASRFSTWNPFPDIGHVREKYGSAKYSTNWLLERLGKAITRRRQFLKYRIEHNDRIVGTGAEEENLRAGPTKTVASTKATTLVGENVLQNIRQAGSDTGNSFGSATSYEQTVFQGDGSPRNLTVPPPPKFAFPTRFDFPKIPFEYGQPFQCPYCFTEQTVENRSAWKTHVFRDLKPYVCTFSECEMLMFRSRNEWFTHELQNHRREWTCQFCQHSPFTTVSDFSKHTETAHAAVLSNSPLKALAMLSEEPVDKILSTACPLCDDWETDLVRQQAILESVLPSPNNLDKKDGLHSKPKLFRRHLGRHMEQLALFALPPNHFDDLEDGSTDGEREEVEDDSSNKEEDDLSQGHQSVSETWSPHIPELSPTQDSLEFDESRLSTAPPQDDELQKHERELRDFESEQQNKQEARSMKEMGLGEEVREPIENDAQNSFAGRPEPRYEQRPPRRPTYFVDERLGGGYERRPSPRAPSPQPVIINNRIYNHDKEYPPELAPRPVQRGRSRSRHGRRRRSQSSSQLQSRSRSRSRSRYRHKSPDTNKYITKEQYELGMARYELEEKRRAQYEASRKSKHKEEEKPKQEYMTEEDYELERAQKELYKFKLEQRIEDEKLIKEEFKLKQLQKQKKDDEEKDAAKKAAEAAVKDFQRKQAEKAMQEKGDKEEQDKEYKERVEEDLRKSGLTDQQIAAVLKKEKANVTARTNPTYTKMARRYLSYETLNAFRIDYTIDQDPEYILINRWVPEYEQDYLWEHTRELRERRLAITSTTNTTVLQVEQGGHNHHHHGHEEVIYDFVKKKERKRDKSPDFITFLSGGKR